MLFHSVVFSTAAGVILAAGGMTKAQQESAPANLKDVEEARQSPGGDAWETDQGEHGSQTDLQSTSRETQSTPNQSAKDTDRRHAQDARANRRHTPPVPQQARMESNQQQRALDGKPDWRMSHHNAEWWYYTADENWMYHRNGQWNRYRQASFQPPSLQSGRSQQVAGQRQGRFDDSNDSMRRSGEQQPYSTGYRGTRTVEQSNRAAPQHHADSQAPTLRYDHCGRAYICENGRKVYVRVRSERHSADYRGTTEGQTQSSASGVAAEQQGRQVDNQNQDTTGDASQQDQTAKQNEDGQSGPGTVETTESESGDNGETPAGSSRNSDQQDEATDSNRLDENRTSPNENQ